VKDVHVTIYDVANRAGVSAATASRALAGLSVNAANLAKVEKAAADLGYIPNEAARSLRVVRTMTVGMVFDQLTSQIGMELLGALTSALDRMGYSLFVSTAQGDADRYDQLVRRFLERRVEALVCVHPHGESKALDRFRAAGVPALAMISKAGGYSSLPLVSNKIEDAAAACIASLAARGHRRIGVISAPRPVSLYDDILRAGGDRAVALQVTRGEGDRLDGAALFDQLAAMPDPPTAIIAFEADAIRVLDAADARGVDVPGQLSLVGVRGRAVNLKPPRLRLSMIHFDPALVGQKAGEILSAWLTEKTPWTEDIRVETGQWIDHGITTGPAPQVSLKR